MKYFLTGVLLAAAVALAAGLPVIQPKDLAAQLAAKGAHPAIFHVGPNVLFRSKHIPGSLYAGPASRPDGLEALKTAAGKLPREQEVVVYCGCCPWDCCPNAKPAVDLLHQMGFTHVKALHVETNFKTDWIDQGYPIEQAQS
jgi:rhodanese-related sulfurtransferase